MADHPMIMTFDFGDGPVVLDEAVPPKRLLEVIEHMAMAVETERVMHRSTLRLWREFRRADPHTPDSKTPAGG